MQGNVLKEIMQGKKGLYPCVTCVEKNRCPFKHNCSMVGIWHMEHEELYEQYGRTVVMDAYEVAAINRDIENKQLKKAIIEKRVERHMK